MTRCRRHSSRRADWPRPDHSPGGKRETTWRISPTIKIGWKNKANVTSYKTDLPLLRVITATSLSYQITYILSNRFKQIDLKEKHGLPPSKIGALL
jgi:hypothetical protein